MARPGMLQGYQQHCRQGSLAPCTGNATWPGAGSHSNLLAACLHEDGALMSALEGELWMRPVYRSMEVSTWGRECSQA